MRQWIDADEMFPQSSFSFVCAPLVLGKLGWEIRRRFCFTSRVLVLVRYVVGCVSRKRDTDTKSLMITLSLPASSSSYRFTLVSLQNPKSFIYRWNRYGQGKREKSSQNRYWLPCEKAGIPAPHWREIGIRTARPCIIGNIRGICFWRLKHERERVLQCTIYINNR